MSAPSQAATYKLPIKPVINPLGPRDLDMLNLAASKFPEVYDLIKRAEAVRD